MKCARFPNCEFTPASGENRNQLGENLRCACFSPSCIRRKKAAKLKIVVLKLRSPDSGHLVQTPTEFTPNLSPDRAKFGVNTATPGENLKIEIVFGEKGNVLGF